MAQVTFQGVVYLSPWLPRPPSNDPIGVTVTVAAPTGPNANATLAIRLRDGQNPLKIVPGTPGATSLTLVPDAPLSNLRGAFIDAQWFTGSTPDWSDPQQYSTSTVITDVPVLVEASLRSDLKEFWLSWLYPDTYAPGIGVRAMLFNTKPSLLYLGYAQLQGVSGRVALTETAPAPGAYVQLQLTAPISGISFAEPFTTGPVMQVYDIPVASPAITAAVYDGRTVQVGWTPPEIPGGGSASLPGAVRLELLIQSGGANPVSHSVVAGSGGGIAEVGSLAEAGGAWTAGGRMRFGNIVGPLGSTAPLLTLSPGLGAITVTPAAITATAALPPSAPAGTKVKVDLLSAGRVISEVTAAGTAVSIPVNAAGIAELSLVAYAQLDAAPPTLPALTGPRSAPFRVPAVAPTFSAITVTPADNGTDWTLTVNWSYPLPAGDISTQTLTLKDANNTVFTFSADGPLGTYTRAVPMASVAAGLVYTLTLAAATAYGTLPTAAQTVNFAAASFVSATSGRDAIHATWTAPAAGPVAAYRLRLLDLSGATPMVVAAVETAATQAAFGFGLDAVPASNLGLDLVILNGPVTFHAKPDGTSKTVAKLLTTAPTQPLATTAVTGKTTITWNAVAGATYLVAFSDGSASVTATGNSLELGRTLGVTDRLRLTVQAQLIADAVTITGPASLPLQVPTAAPKLLAADTDGVSVTANWEPVTDSINYTVSLMGNGAFIRAVGTTATEIRFSAALTAAEQPYSVIVQAVTPAGTGLPSDPLPVFRTAWFASTQALAQAVPHLLPSSDINFAATTITLYLPPLGPAVIPDTGVGAFQLTRNEDAATKDALPQLLTFAPTSNVWTFPNNTGGAPRIRAQVKVDYIAFLQAVETAGAKPWGISLLQQVIARWMPQTFAESPYYAFGLDLDNGAGNGSIDLRPGLVLRVGSANYVNAWSGDQPSFFNGFAGGPVMDFDIGDATAGNGDWTVSADAFMSRLVASGVVTVGAPVTNVGGTAGIAEAADLFFTGFMQPFYRLFFPGTLLNPTSMGNLTPHANFALAAADTYAHLSASTPVPGPGSTVVYFRGRAMVRVMMRISVNGAEAVVPVGTTAGNLLDRFGNRPPATGLHLSGLRLDRSGGPALAIVSPTAPPAPPPVVPPPLVYGVGQRHQVRLDWATMANYGAPFGAMDLPLLPGDRISFP